MSPPVLRKMEHRYEARQPHCADQGREYRCGAWSSAPGACSKALRASGTMKPERLSAMVKALEINLDRQQWFAILEASEGRPVA